MPPSVCQSCPSSLSAAPSSCSHCCIPSSWFCSPCLISTAVSFQAASCPAHFLFFICSLLPLCISLYFNRHWNRMRNRLCLSLQGRILTCASMRKFWDPLAEEEFSGILVTVFCELSVWRVKHCPCFLPEQDDYVAGCTGLLGTSPWKVMLWIFSGSYRNKGQPQKMSWRTACCHVPSVQERRSCGSSLGLYHLLWHWRLLPSSLPSLCVLTLSIPCVLKFT